MIYENLDPRVSLADQVHSDHDGPVVMVSTYIVEPAEADEFLATWCELSRIMRAQPGNLGAQMHRGIGGANIFVNVAEWETLDAFRAAYERAAFWDSEKKVPEGVIARPILVEKIAPSRRDA